MPRKKVESIKVVEGRLYIIAKSTIRDSVSSLVLRAADNCGEKLFINIDGDVGEAIKEGVANIAGDTITIGDFVGKFTEMSFR